MDQMREVECELRRIFQAGWKGKRSDEWQSRELPNGDRVRFQKVNNNKYEVVVELEPTEEEPKPKLCIDKHQLDTPEEAWEYAWPVYRAVILDRHLRECFHAKKAWLDLDYS